MWVSFEPDGLDSAFLSGLQAAVDSHGVIAEPELMSPHLSEWRGLYTGQAAMLVSPASTAQVAEVIKLCAAYNVGVVPQGGNTGLVGGAMPQSSATRPQIILSASRLNNVLALDADNYTITAQAGCVLANLQAAAADADRLFPLSLAAEGSCQLGGNISTNAGGINVLRFGTMRDLVLGLEVVLPDGRVLEVLRSLRKDNTGYDLKQLFIGAEGTLGFITAASCKLFPRAASRATALLAFDDPAAAIILHSIARRQLGDDLVAFELISRPAMELVTQFMPGTRNPMDEAWPWYLLLEINASDDQAQAKLGQFLEQQLEEGKLRDGVLAQSERQSESLWRLRHNISEAQKLAGAGIKHDIAVPVSKVATFIERASAVSEKLVPGVRVVAFGHLGDGNIHFNLNQPVDMDRKVFLEQWERVSEHVHAIVDELDGSFSAEHGIGLLKRADLVRYRGGVELDLMRQLKATLDPRGIMNPGKLLGPSG